MTGHCSLITVLFTTAGTSSTAKTPDGAQLTSHKTFTWGLDLSGNLQGAGGVGGLLAVTKHEAQSTTNTYYVTYDANGNVSEYIDNSGTIVEHYEYSPFGKLTASDGTMAGEFNH